ncbi:hypothetical protein [Cognaticolwellia beringensis]|uniref:YiaAB two helix domain-containing protein n=1 Tax=Cognaticolwellia beringensis TaxID=1967665 RepID=A0A222GD55_9GAMM|nr:hypothetical protein [Cognaticolwellia beringensis]ASP49721.1 hypothetical protein B5D82_19270 [Cognaticolwellia beringensis]
MNSPVKVWLIYSLIGFVVSISITVLFDKYPGIRLFSNEAIIFAVMFSTMLSAINKAFKVSRNQEKYRLESK